MVPCSHPGSGLEPLFSASDYITGQRFEVARCGECGFAVTVPQPSPDTMGDYYPAGYYGGGDRRFPAPVECLQRWLYARRARWVQRLHQHLPGRVLDVGCGRGLLLRAFRIRGWEVEGTELSESAARYARARLNLPVHIGPLQEQRFPSRHFDAVVLWHVLEHVPDPRVELAEIGRILKPGGVLMVGVPNLGSWEARACRDKWFHLDVPRHLTHFTSHTLRTALAQAGFQICDNSCFAPEYDCFSFTQSFLNRLGLRHNLLYNLLRGQTAKVLSQQPHRNLLPVLATLALGPLLGLLSVPATMIAALLGQGATITLIARRRS